MKALKESGVVVIAALALALAAPAFAQVKTFKMYGATTYDKAKEVTLQGTIEIVQRHSGADRNPAIHLLVKTGEGLTEVHVAPFAYLEQEGVKFVPGEKVTLTGSRTRFEGKWVVVAREIKTETMEIVVRDENGRPRWERAAETAVP